MEENFKENRKLTKKDYKKIFENIKKSYKFVKSNKKSLIICIIVSILTIPVSVLTPILSAQILLALNGSLYEDLLRIAAFIFIVYSIQHLLWFMSRIVYKKYIVNVVYGIQKELMKETFKLSSECFDEHGTGIFIDRLRQDTNVIANIFDDLANILIQIFSNLGIFIVIFTISKIMFFYFLLCGINEFIVSKKRIKIYYERFGEIRDLEEKNTGLVAELIRGVRDVKVLNSTDVFMKKFDKRVSEVNDKNIKLTIKNNKFYLFSEEINEVLDYLFYFIGVMLTNFNLLTASNFVVLYMYRSKARYLFTYIVSMMESIKTFNFSANRVYEIIDGEKFSKEKFGNIKLNHINGDFEFKNVSFAYKKEKEILHNISFKVKANTTVAFVGKSGSGKSTIFSLLNKLYNVSDGKIFIDGYDINTLTKDSIRNNMSIITQNPYIFNLSIRDNLLLVKEKVSEKEMIKACKTACLHDFVMSLPNGYDTIVGEGGITLSGGERQRLAIARALIKKTEIILFDEATSALDNETQEKIQKAIHNLKGKYTILIIAHRLSTIVNSDKIIMIDKGKIVGEGTHKYLMEKSLKYQKLYQADLLK